MSRVDQNKGTDPMREATERKQWSSSVEHARWGRNIGRRMNVSVLSAVKPISMLMTGS